MIGLKNTYAARGGGPTAAGGAGPTFHPKVYFFTNGEKADAIVGSANLTNGGPGKNYESSIHISGSSSEPVFADIKAAVQQYALLGQSVTQDIADTYRRDYKTARARQKVRGPFLPGDGKDWNRATSALVRMRWDDYVQEIRKRPAKDVNMRLQLLQKCREIFASTSTFGNFSSAEWKFIAGTLGNPQAGSAALLGFIWGGRHNEGGRAALQAS